VNFKDFFSESSDYSMTRLLSFMCVVAALLIALYGVYRQQEVSAIVGLFLGSGLSAKVAQSFAEKESQK
jgi:hypothetical protein